LFNTANRSRNVFSFTTMFSTKSAPASIGKYKKNSQH
jgi:hypothetical protein